MNLESVYCKGKEFQIKNGVLEICQQESLDIPNIENLKNQKNLKTLLIWGNQISNIDGLFELVNLKSNKMIPLKFL